jgi:Ser/Thr protein kinase RdoA (MazF antagonist)
MNNQLENKIKNLYNLSTIVSFEKVDKGFLSENYKLVTKEGEYFLKKYRFNDEGRIREIHSVKEYFNEGGISVIMPIKNNDNKAYFEIEGSFFAVFPFVSGIQPERGDLTKDMIISLGKTLGKIHLLGKSSSLKMDKLFKDWSKEKSLETASQIELKLKNIAEKNEFDILTQKVVSFKKELIQASSIKFEDLGLKSDHLIHGDYLDQNVFFDEKGKVKYVFDFEKTGLEPRSQELFRSATYSFLNTDFNDISVENIKLFVKSYLEVYPMSKEELENGLMAHYLKSIHSFWVEKEHHLKGNNRVDLFLEFGFKRIRFMSERLNDLL